MKRGIWYAILAYVCWGVLPIYWKQLAAVEPFQVIAHRVVWSFAFLLGLLVILRLRYRQPLPKLSAANLKVYLPAGFLIGTNWFLYVWAVNSGHILEASLGYFINPLINVLFGVLFFRERLRAGEWIGIALAATGVLYIGFFMDEFPWIAVVLALSFAIYSVVKKRAPLQALSGLTLETSLLTLPALAFILWKMDLGQSAFLNVTISIDWLLIGTGVVTTIPLLFFAAAARMIPLSTIGILQYLSPTLQFLCGILIYHEPFNQHKLLGFSLVWVGLAVFLASSYAKSHSK